MPVYEVTYPGKTGRHTRLVKAANKTEAEYQIRFEIGQVPIFSMEKAQPKDAAEARRMFDKLITRKCVKCGAIQ